MLILFFASVDAEVAVPCFAEAVVVVAGFVVVVRGTVEDVPVRVVWVVLAGLAATCLVDDEVPER